MMVPPGSPQVRARVCSYHVPVLGAAIEGGLALSASLKIFLRFATNSEKILASLVV